MKFNILALSLAALSFIVLKANGSADCFDHHADYYGNDLSSVYVSTATQCQDACANNPRCVEFTWADPSYEVYLDSSLINKCHLKDSYHTEVRRVIGLISGPKHCVTCVNTRDNGSGNTCTYQLNADSSCQDYLGYKDCDKECNLCACSTASGTAGEHCSGHGTCEASCNKWTCTDAKCKCNPGWTGSKCEISAVALWAEEAMDKTCKTQLQWWDDAQNQWDCQSWCEAEGSLCVGIAYSHNFPKHCKLCRDDILHEAASGFGFYRRPTE